LQRYPVPLQLAAERCCGGEHCAALRCRSGPNRKTQQQQAKRNPPIPKLWFNGRSTEAVRSCAASASVVGYSEYSLVYCGTLSTHAPARQRHIFGMPSSAEYSAGYSEYTLGYSEYPLGYCEYSRTGQAEAHLRHALERVAAHLVGDALDDAVRAPLLERCTRVLRVPE
jgi:hypothetical protein